MFENYQEDLPVNQQDIIRKYNSLSDQVKNGEEDAMPLFLELKELITTLKLVQDKIKYEAINAARKNEICNGYKLTVTSKKTWTFDHIAEYVFKKNELNTFEEYLKASTIAARAIGQNQIVNTETGEIWPLAEQKESEVFITATKHDLIKRAIILKDTKAKETFKKKSAELLDKAILKEMED